MDWRVVNEQQQEARWRVFLMFVLMALLIIRTGLVSRSLLAVYPAEKVQQDAAQATNHHRSSMSPAELYQATLALLCLAEAAGRLFIVQARAVWELMNQPLPGPLPERSSPADSLCDHPIQRLDTS